MNIKVSAILVLLAMLVLLDCGEMPYRKVIHNYDPEAKCLDGSPALMYIHEGGEKKKFLLYFVGGGYCAESTLSETVESCYQRSKTPLGSSTLWPDLLTGAGYLSTDPALNAFANYTKIVFAYCDGAFHQGNTNAPLKYKDTVLYFRGALITRAHLFYLVGQYRLDLADKVIVTGASAGAIATFLWNNYIKDLVIDPTVVESVVDSGTFMNFRSVKTGTYKVLTHFFNLFKLSNVDEQTPIEICNHLYPEEEYMCLFIKNAYGSLSGRILLINSMYDSWAIQNLMDIGCLVDGKHGKSLTNCTKGEISVIEEYRAEVNQFFAGFLAFTKNSVWAIACSTHVYASYADYYNVDWQRVPGEFGITVRDAVQKFIIAGKRVTATDDDPWPSNQPCA